MRHTRINTAWRVILGAAALAVWAFFVLTAVR